MPSSTSPELIIGGEDEVKELPFGIESEDSSRYTDDPYGDAEVLGPHDDMRRLPASLRSIPPRIYTSTLIGRKVRYVDSQIFNSNGGDLLRHSIKSSWHINNSGELMLAPMHPRLYTRGGGGRLSADYSFNNVRGNRKIKQILFGIKNATTTNNTFYNPSSLNWNYHNARQAFFGKTPYDTGYNPNGRWDVEFEPVWFINKSTQKYSVYYGGENPNQLFCY